MNNITKTFSTKEKIVNFNGGKRTITILLKHNKPIAFTDGDMIYRAEKIDRLDFSKWTQRHTNVLSDKLKNKISRTGTDKTSMLVLLRNQQFNYLTR